MVVRKLAVWTVASSIGADLSNRNCGTELAEEWMCESYRNLSCIVGDRDPKFESTRPRKLSYQSDD